MNKIVLTTLVGIAILATAFFSYRWVASSVSENVRLEVAKMVDRENSNLPRLVDEKIVLEFIDSDVEENQLTFKYQCEIEIPENRWKDVQNKTNRRTLEDRNIVRAMKNGVRVFHEFKGIGGHPLLEFETKQ